MGLEPTRRNRHKILSLARLPIPTLPRTDMIIAKRFHNVNTFLPENSAVKFNGYPVEYREAEPGLCLGKAG